MRLKATNHKHKTKDEISLSYLEHQYEQQQGRQGGVELTLPGQGVEVCESVPWVLQDTRPLLLGHDAAAQVKPTYRRCQRQLTDAKESPRRQQVPVAFPEETQDPPHQEVQHQGEEDNLENMEP